MHPHSRGGGVAAALPALLSLWVGMAAWGEYPTPAVPPPLRTPFTIAAVQLRIDEATYSSVDAFRDHVLRAARGAVGHGADLLVFPEYVGVFAALIPHARDIAASDTLAQTLERISRAEPWVHSPRDVFLLNSGFARGVIIEVFGGLARDLGVPVIAGTYFARVVADTGETQLRNRALVFGADGTVVYEQDKVFLTDYETVLGVTPGDIELARVFDVAGMAIGLTVCRDTFFAEWEPRLAPADLWVDIKANGTEYTPQERNGFRRALPARLLASGVPVGATVCLTGEFQELVWQGESSLAVLESGQVVYARVASDPVEEEVLVFDIPRQ